MVRLLPAQIPGMGRLRLRLRVRMTRGGLEPRPQVAGLILGRRMGVRLVNTPTPVRDRLTVRVCGFLS